MKVLVTGNAGAGKSTLSRRIANTFELPFVSLDSVVWQERWKKTPADERDKRIAEIVNDESWVVDGVSTAVLHAADVVVFLDVSRRRCLWRATKRNLPHMFSSRPELPPRCPEILIIPTLLKIIWQFDSRVRPGILQEKAKRIDSGTFLHVRDAKDVESVETALSSRLFGLRP